MPTEGALTPDLTRARLFHRGAVARSGNDVRVDPTRGPRAAGARVAPAVLWPGRVRPTLPLLALPLLAACPTPAPPCGIDVATLVAERPSTARVFDELALQAIRRDRPNPPVHARNLFHLSAAMYDAWAAYDSGARGLFSTEKGSGGDAERDVTVAYAAYTVLHQRYAAAVNAEETASCFEDAMDALELDPEDTEAAAAALGVRIARQILDRDDGANEAGGYADTTGWSSPNPTLRVNGPYREPADLDVWQPLEFEGQFTQNGQASDPVQPFMSPHWREVTPFAMPRPAESDLYTRAGPRPAARSPEVRAWVLDVVARTARLVPTSTATIDASPGALGNNSLGADDGRGHAQNPATGAPYAPHVVPLHEFATVLKDFWADGPRSETPPGHWNVFANDVSDALRAEQRKLFGQGEPVGRLEWDVKVYLALNGALHDAAITAWSIKRHTESARPIALVRNLAHLGQSSDPSRPRYHADGLPLLDGVVELVGNTLQIKAHTGEWVDAESWRPAQPDTFLTPAFPGFVSGHSTFSRAAAEVLAALTGSPYWPGGLETNDGPTPGVLQWATYFDAADQAGQSRLWGGIHIQPDDLVGRRLGHEAGLGALAKVRSLYGAP